MCAELRQNPRRRRSDDPVRERHMRPPRTGRSEACGVPEERFKGWIDKRRETCLPRDSQIRRGCCFHRYQSLSNRQAAILGTGCWIGVAHQPTPKSRISDQLRSPQWSSTYRCPDLPPLSRLSGPSLTAAGLPIKGKPQCPAKFGRPQRASACRDRSCQVLPEHAQALLRPRQARLVWSRSAPARGARPAARPPDKPARRPSSRGQGPRRAGQNRPIPARSMPQARGNRVQPNRFPS